MNENNTTPQTAGDAGNSGSSRWLIIGVVILAILGIGWFFSGGFTRSAVERSLQQAGVDASFNRDGTSTYSNEDGTVTVGGGSYPDNWPGDVPQYPNGEILFSGSSNPQTGSAGATVSFTTSDSPAEVIEYYKRELESNGWHIEATSSVSGMTIVSATKGDQSFGVWAAASDGVTQVTAGVGM